MNRVLMTGRYLVGAEILKVKEVEGGWDIDFRYINKKYRTFVIDLEKFVSGQLELVFAYQMENEDE